MEEEEPSDFIRLEKFQPVMVKILVERRFRPATEEMLLKAFEVSHYLPTCAYTYVCTCVHA